MQGKVKASFLIERGYCFVQPHGQVNDRAHRYFAYIRDIKVPLGHFCLLRAGTEVVFEPTTDAAGGRAATNVALANPPDILDVSETSTIIKWSVNGDGVNLARRSCGCVVRVYRGDIVSEGEETLCIGSMIRHKVYGKPTRRGVAYIAVQVEIYREFSPSSSPEEVPATPAKEQQASDR